MSNLTISYKNKTLLIDSFEAQSNVEVVKEASLFGKLGLGQKEYADIYFHSGAFDKQTIEACKNAKLIIANCKKAKKEILKQTEVDETKVKVIYPAINESYLKPKESKRKVAEQFNFDEDKKIILFTAKNFKQNGAKEFCDIVASLNYKHRQIIIAGEESQITQLKFQASKYGFGEEVLLIENYPDMNLLFSAADIFVLPTFINGFSANVLKAMFFKTVVLVSANCASSELVDVFSTINAPSDRATPFKLDALLGNKEELKKVKKQNREEAQKYSLEKQIEQLNSFVENI